MTQPALELEVVALIRQLGPRNAEQLQQYLPEHKVTAIQEALNRASYLHYLKPTLGGAYAYQPKPPAAVEAANDRLEPERDAATIVRQALGSRSPLELAWLARSDDQPTACMPC